MRHVLIANRAAIAARAARTCRDKGLLTTALSAASDPQDAHARAADRHVTIGGWDLMDTYDSVERVVDAARRCGADTVYPGYGALAENPALAARLSEAGIGYVGPDATALAWAGDKYRAIETAAAVAIPVLAHRVSANLDELAGFAAGAGWPVIAKPATGYGGQGVRVLRSRADLDQLSDPTQTPPRWYVEPYRAAGRVIGVTLAVDSAGTVVELGERESLLVANGLKLLEASPVLGVPADLVASMRRDAARLAVEMGLRNVVTVEFLAEPDGYVFLEVNGRLPLAYRMSESQTGADLIGLQLDIADGRAVDPGRLPVDRGRHCLEARLFVRPTQLGQYPRVGTLDQLELAPADGVSYACTVDPDRPVWYELILAQALATAESRAGAGRRLLHALRSCRVTGIDHYADDILAFLRTGEHVPGTGGPRPPAVPIQYTRRESTHA